MSYFVVGLLATLVEWGSFWVLDYAIGIQYLIATIIAMIISTFSNWLFGRLMTFRNAEKGNTLIEIGKIYITSFAGIGLNVLLMWIMVDKCTMNEMLSKVIATGFVFFYNYFIRTLYIYKNK
jgi:putative flippase GtrA